MINMQFDAILLSRAPAITTAELVTLQNLKAAQSSVGVSNADSLTPTSDLTRCRAVGAKAGRVEHHTAPDTDVSPWRHRAFTQRAIRRLRWAIPWVSIIQGGVNSLAQLVLNTTVSRAVNLVFIDGLRTRVIGAESWYHFGYIVTRK